MEHLSLVRTDILKVLINLVDVLWWGAGIDTTPFWICVIKFIYDFIDVIYHAELDSSAFSVIEFHLKVVVKIASVGGNCY